MSLHSTETFTPDRLPAGIDEMKAIPIEIAANSGALVRGTVLGKITKAVSAAAGTNTGAGVMSAVSMGVAAIAGAYTVTCIGGALTATAAAVAGNTAGSGAMTLATPATAAGVKPGVYRVTCVEPAENAGTFVVEDPDGITIGTATAAVAFDGVVKFTIADATDFIVGDAFTITVARAVPGGGGQFSVTSPSGVAIGTATVGTPFTSTHVNFSIADGNPDFAVGDSFTITIGAGSGKYKTVNSANVDGSDEADCILTDAVPAATAAQVATAYISGEFNEDACVFGGTDTADTHRDTLRRKGIILRPSVAR